MVIYSHKGDNTWYWLGNNRIVNYWLRKWFKFWKRKLIAKTAHIVVITISRLLRWNIIPVIVQSRSIFLLIFVLSAELIWLWLSISMINLDIKDRSNEAHCCQRENKCGLYVCWMPISANSGRWKWPFVFDLRQPKKQKFSNRGEPHFW